ncbi:hypothetical protein BSFP_009500 [Burkholderia stabilis]|uniref:Uncharacterized protein n=1 Tax=Burkholderia stabilis TaxID=95485 RepID=A0A1Y1BEB4_9BURK|nr:hypothetical protein BSFP_009500 [Burkholderia stabilis]
MRRRGGATGGGPSACSVRAGAMHDTASIPAIGAVFFV